MTDTQEQSVVQKFSEFIGCERGRYLDDDNNRVAFSLSQIARYLEFLQIIKSRYDDVAQQAVALTLARIENAKQHPGERPMNAADVRELESHRQLQVLLHLEITSFFLFAKILLDKIAQAIEDFFGQVRSASLQSHDKLCKNILVFAQGKGLTIPDGLSDLVAALRQEIADYRDKEITHFRNPRAVHATSFSSAGDAHVSTVFLYPKSTDNQSNSPDIAGVHQRLDTYVDYIIALIATNRSKSHYQLRSG